jgi:hypothetical protein
MTGCSRSKTRSGSRWRYLATAAGVTDLAVFEMCFNRTDPTPHVLEGGQLGKELDVQGTPRL